MRATTGNAARVVEATDFILPERRGRRPVPRAPGGAVDIEDAIFEIVRPAMHPGNSFRREMPSPRVSPAARPANPLLAGLERVEAILKTLSPQTFVVLLSGLCVGVFWALGGFSALAEGRVPEQGARHAWVVTGLATEERVENGMPLALVRGRIENRTAKPIPVPVLVAQLGNTQLGRIGGGIQTIKPSGQMEFSARFQLAGGKASDIRLIDLSD